MSFTENIYLACWNIDGLFQRIGGQRFCKLDNDQIKAEINKFDIIGLLETHCGHDEPILLDVIKTNTRKKTENADNSFGGLAVCVSKMKLSQGYRYYQ